MHKISSYKGAPTISLNPDSKWPFTFGIAKARLILESLEAIRAFAEGGTEQSRRDSQRSHSVRFGDGKEYIQNVNGRCEDAPCCGCCTI